MKAVAMTRALPIEHPESLVALELPEPGLRARDLLVAVRAISVNPVDAKVRKSRTPAPDSPQVLGWDAAGVVLRLGAQASQFAVGDEVYFAGDITRAGANSELCAVDERIVARKPKTLDFAEAAALPLTALTAYEGMFQRMRVARGAAGRGKRLLIVGGAGGVGSLAIQLAKCLSEVTVIATASRPESRAWVKQLGADHVIDHREPLAFQLQQLGFAHVDYAFCTADTEPHFAGLVEALAPQGSIGLIVGTKGPVDLGLAQSKSISVAWELMFTRPMFETEDMIEQQRILAEVAELVDRGRLRSTLSTRLAPIDAVTLREAHARIESGHTIGKIVLEGWA